MKLHDLTFAELRNISLARCSRWHPGGLSEWSLSDWFTATTGELGEAANVAKKLNRIRDGAPGNSKEEDEDALRGMLADEIADTLIYLDILAASEGIDLAAAVASKFNRTSAKVGFPERLREIGGGHTQSARDQRSEHSCVLKAANLPDDSLGGGQEHSEIMREIGHG